MPERQAARSILPIAEMRTRMVMAGHSKAEIVSAIKAAFANKQLPDLENGAMAFMMSKSAYLLNTIQFLLLKLLKHEERSFIVRDVGLLMLREILIETLACRDLVYEENVRKPWMEKGKTRETMNNFYDMHTRTAAEKVEAVIERIKKKAVERSRKFKAEIEKQLNLEPVRPVFTLDEPVSSYVLNTGVSQVGPN